MRLIGLGSSAQSAPPFARQVKGGPATLDRPFPGKPRYARFRFIRAVQDGLPLAKPRSACAIVSSFTSVSPSSIDIPGTHESCSQTASSATLMASRFGSPSGDCQSPGTFPVSRMAVTARSTRCCPACPTFLTHPPTSMGSWKLIPACPAPSAASSPVADNSPRTSLTRVPTGGKRLPSTATTARGNVADADGASACVAIKAGSEEDVRSSL